MIADAPTAAHAPSFAHVTNGFTFDIAAPPARVAPLFGPQGERAWAGGHWDPAFLYPLPATDVQGAVFTVPHGPLTSIWVNTVFDLAGGHMQYVCVLPDIMAATIDVRLFPAGDGTHAEVYYTRTALREEVNADVTAMGEKDRQSGPQWQSAIDKALGL
jgi:hypothetical protein